MAVVAVLKAKQTDEQWIKQFDKNTRFCIISDHYNVDPVGWPTPGKFLKQKTPLAEQLMLEFPNVTFLTSTWHNGLDKLDNVHLYLSALLYFHTFLKQENFHPCKDKQLHNCNLLGGKTRINRTLAGHWFAKNYDLSELLYRWKQNNDLKQVHQIIKDSNYYNNKHITNKLFLADNFDYSKKKIEHTNNHDRFVKYFLPNIYNKSILSIVLETAGIELSNSIAEKSLYSFAGHGLAFFTGTYQIDNTLERIGFQTFRNIFNYEHLNSTDRYALTIMGLENNKHIISSKQKLLDLQNDNQLAIRHNFDVACRSDHLINYFKQQNKIFKECIKYNDQGPINVYELGIENTNNKFLSGKVMPDFVDMI
tara:strand:+ start:5843 stop:6937 length:1095 start_codon:yes stop_codon:yes gene_type:complete